MQLIFFTSGLRDKEGPEWPRTKDRGVQGSVQAVAVSTKETPRLLRNSI